jgi:solute carrier family 25 protein 38
MARTMSTVIMLPISVVKTRFEAFGTHSYKSTFDALRTISKTEGIRGIFKGFFLCSQVGLFAGGVPSILRDAPFSGFYFLFYTQFQSKFHDMFTPNDMRPGTMVNLLSGGVAAIIATVMTHPQDMIKTRMQIARGSSATMMDVFRGIYKVVGVVLGVDCGRKKEFEGYIRD